MYPNSMDKKSVDELFRILAANTAAYTALKDYFHALLEDSQAVLYRAAIAALDNRGSVANAQVSKGYRNALRDICDFMEIRLKSKER